MKDEEMAEEIANKRCHEIMCYGHCSFNSPKHHRCGEWHREYNCALEGIQAGRPQWHKVTDKLPPFDKKVLVRVGENTLIGLRDSSDKCWCVGDFFDTILSDRLIIAWCEIPTFDKE